MKKSREKPYSRGLAKIFIRSGFKPFTAYSGIFVTELKVWKIALFKNYVKSSFIDEQILPLLLKCFNEVGHFCIDNPCFNIYSGLRKHLFYCFMFVTASKLFSELWANWWHWKPLCILADKIINNRHQVQRDWSLKYDPLRTYWD